MEPQGLPANVNLGIEGATSIGEVVAALISHGCSDLAPSIDLNSCREEPWAIGGTCDVYRGALHNGTKIAIKSLRVYGLQCNRDSETQKVLKRAAKEIYRWAQLKHPNVLPLMGLAVFKGYISMISEWMENGDLTSYLKQKPDANRLMLCMDVWAGLCYIHMKGMVHGDLKGANIMVSPDGIAMIADFGSARWKDLTLGLGKTTSRGLSYQWAAPELLRGNGVPQISMESDVYAYGMTVLEALTGKTPNEWGISKKGIPNRPKIDIPDSLWKLLTSCWAQTPSKRPKIMKVGGCLEALLPPGVWPRISNEKVIAAIVKNGCLDLTSSIDSTATTNCPSMGGGFGDIYQGALHNGTKVAIKTLRVYEGLPRKGDSREQEVLKHTARELNAWSRLRHPNVLPLMGLAGFKGRLTMVSRWMENGDLTSYLRRNPDADHHRLCMDICIGLCHIHMNGMVHGNLKGANIMISPKGIAMIADSGNAQLRDPTLRFSNTKNHALLIRWAAPELLKVGDNIPQMSAEADVYAYGMTVLETLTGKVPYHWISDAQVIKSIVLNGEVPSRPDIPIAEGLWELLTSCWTRAPTDRPKIMSVADRLEDIFSLRSIEGIIGALARHGCSDLTSLIDLTACSDRPITGGGSGDVYRGALHDGIRIAIKSSRVQDSSRLEVDSEGWKVLESISQELYLWLRLKHCNVLPLMGLAVFKGRISMISEWMENGNLNSYLRSKPDADRGKLCLDICAGLCYIHENGMVHGDLKGANIMISPDGTAMIADFGNAHLEDLTLKFIKAANRGLSIRWAAPELLQDGGPQASMEADVYAYGMTVLEVLTGEVPYEGTIDGRVPYLVAVEKKVPPRPDVGISDGLWELLISCWSQTPSERPNIKSVNDDLKTLIPLISLVSGSTLRMNLLARTRKFGARIKKLALGRFGSILDQIMEWINQPEQEKRGSALGQNISPELYGINDNEQRNELYPQQRKTVEPEGISSSVKPEDETIRNTGGQPIEDRVVLGDLSPQKSQDRSSSVKPECVGAPDVVAQRLESERMLRAPSPLGAQCALSLAQVAAELAPVPCIGPLVRSLMSVFQAVERSKVNKEQWKLLQGRCVMVLRIAGAQVSDHGWDHYPGLENAASILEDTLNKIKERAWHYNEMNEMVAFMQFQSISDEIRHMFSDLDACLNLFSYATDVAQSQWVGEFCAVQAKEVAELQRVHSLLAGMNTNLDTISQDRDEITKMVDILHQELIAKSNVLQNQATTTVANIVDAQNVVRTILAVTNLQLPPKLLADKQCILDANVPIKTGITCDIYPATFLGGEKVAKKVFRIGMSDREYVQRYAERFLRIAELWSRFRSDYTLPFYGIGMESFEGERHFQLYMVSPFMRNFDAVTYLKQYRSNPGMKQGILRIITDAAHGLQYLHNRNPPVVHSGMRGDNILITDSGGGILGGFGLTKALESAGDDRILPAVMTGKTESQRWMAPELFMDDTPVLKTSCDVWGWAMATLEIISGSIPYHSHTQALTVMLKVQKGPPRRQDHIKFEDYAYRPDEMWELLERCWNYEPDERPTMDEVVARLMEIANMEEYVRQ